MKYSLAIDIGASSGKAFLCSIEEDRFCLQEINRFENGMKPKGTTLTWDVDALFASIKKILLICKQMGKIPSSMAIDTWGVDYVLLDENDELILPVYAYRDPRGFAASRLVHRNIPFSELYQKTCIQFQPFNTLYQLYDDLSIGRLRKAKHFLMIPEYLSFLLTGKKCHEYTNASTTGLLNAQTKKWDRDIIDRLGLPEALFLQEPCMPPFKLGTLKESIAQEVGFSCDVMMVASHDTASAVVALPSILPCTFLSSGTWSLLGSELSKPFINANAEKANFTNEGGIESIRFLKNIMGLWLIQCLQKEYPEWSFPQIAQAAKKARRFDYHLDIQNEKYLYPESISSTVKHECRQKHYPVPRSVGGLAYALFCSLANVYAETLDTLANITGSKSPTLVIVGGGVNNQFFNDLIAKKTQKKIQLGAVEATALGNSVLQWKYLDETLTHEKIKKMLIRMENQ